MKATVVQAGCVLIGLSAFGAEPPNRLTADEVRDGWKLLWDGKTFDGWCHADGRPVDTGWSVKDGALTLKPNRIWEGEGKWAWRPVENGRAKGGKADIMTVAEYRDFDLRFSFKMEKGANSGVKYYYDPKRNLGTALEYQVLDPAHPVPPHMTAEQFENRRVASLYQFYAAHATKHLRKRGEWNEGRIVSRGRHVEHWLNGVRVVSYERGSEGFRAALRRTKWGDAKFSVRVPWGEADTGHILLQDHEDAISFRDLKILSL